MHKTLLRDAFAFYRLEYEAIEPDAGERCQECGDLAPGDRLLRFSTVRGAKQRAHDGLFCSIDCHDRWHGLKPG